MRQIERDRGKATPIMMTDNFRSTQALLRTANEVACELTNRATEVHAFEGLPEGNAPEIKIFPNPDDEAIGVARQCADLINNGSAPNEIAILCRANKPAELFGDPDNADALENMPLLIINCNKA